MGKGRNYNMLDTFEFQGTWFLPEQSFEHGQKGTLKYSPNDIKLELNGAFNDNDDLKKENVILGVSASGEKFSLFSCQNSKLNISWPGYATTTYSVNHFFVGTSFIYDDKEKVFQSCDFSTTYLDAWLAFPVMTERVISRERFEYIIDIPESNRYRKRVFLKDEGCSIGEECNYTSIPPKEYYLSEETRLTFQRFYSIRPQPWNRKDDLEFYYDVAHRIRCLIALFIDYPICFTYLDLVACGENGASTCRFFFRQPGLSSGHPKRKIVPYDLDSVIIPRRKIANSIDTIFKKWFFEFPNLYQAIGPYISDLYLPIYEENRFLNTMRGLEVFHRFYISTSSSDALDYTLLGERNKLRDFICENIADENQQYFLSRIEYEEDEIKLRPRLRSIFENIPEALLIKILGKRKRKSFLDSIIDTRNYYTHRDSKSKYHCLIDDYTELSDTTKKLQIILQYFALTAIGIDSSIVLQQILGYRYNHRALYS